MCLQAELRRGDLWLDQDQAELVIHESSPAAQTDMG